MNKLSEDESRDLWGWFVAGVVFWSGLILFLVMAWELGGLESLSWSAVIEWLF